MEFRVYILYATSFDKFYIGQTDCIQSRFRKHNAGLVRSTKAFIPWTLVHTIEKATRSEAVVLERKLKNLTKKRLIKFIEKYKQGSWS